MKVINYKKAWSERRIVLCTMMKLDCRDNQRELLDLAEVKDQVKDAVSSIACAWIKSKYI